MTGVFLSTMDSGMVNVALPTIMRFFDLSLERAELVVTLYLLTITITLVFWGKLADRLGRGNIYLSGMAIFSIGAVACYLASGFGWLLLSRFIQALGASMMMSSGPAIIKTVFPADHLGRSLGLVGIATACGLLTGPFVSGLLLSSFSWRMIFLIHLPITVVAVILGGLFLIGQLNQKNNNKPQPFDWKGSCCWVAMVVLALTVFHSFDGFLSLMNTSALLGFSALFYLFLRIEERHSIRSCQ